MKRVGNFRGAFQALAAISLLALPGCAFLNRDNTPITNYVEEKLSPESARAQEALVPILWPVATITLIADATKLAKQGKLREGVGLPHPPMYYGIQDFMASVTGGKPSACPAPLGLRAAVLGIKAHEAVMTGKEIVFEEDWFKIG